MQWISVNAGLPAMDETVLLFCAGGNYDGTIMGSITAYGWVDHDEGLALTGVTYWMPLPNPPTT